MTSRFLFAFAAFGMFLAAPAEARLSPAEQRMTATVDAERERTVSLLEQWVNQNSGSLNIAGVEAVGRMVRPEFEALGFKVEWIDLKPIGRAGHLVATHKGNGRGKRMLLIAHLDTVFEPHSPFQRWVRKGNEGEGPGAGDDKGGIAVIVAALRAMKAAGTLKNADIVVFLTGDEEDAASPIEATRGKLIEYGKWVDVALDFEGLAVDEGKEMGSTARRSSDSWTLTVTARSGHSSGIFRPDTGYGAIYELARIVDSFRRELPEDKLTYNVGLVAGGETMELSADKVRASATGKTNIIAATAKARGDLRGLTPE
jgi:glutamate carboxypeptidase